MVKNYNVKKIPYANKLFLPKGETIRLDIPRTKLNSPTFAATITGYRRITTNSLLLTGTRIELREGLVYYNYYPDNVPIAQWEFVYMQVENWHSDRLVILLQSNTDVYLQAIEVFENIFDPADNWDDENWINRPNVPPPLPPTPTVPHRTTNTNLETYV